MPIVLAGSRQIHRAALTDTARFIRESDAHYRAFDERMLRVRTPDSTLNDAAQ